MSQLTVRRLTELLSDYVRTRRDHTELILIGGLALQAYGYEDRTTGDVDAEITGDLEALMGFFDRQGIPADIGEDISGWSVVSMPPGYRNRTRSFVDQPRLHIRLLDPVDFVVAKLRRGTDLDLDDAHYITRRFRITASAIKSRAEAAVAASPKDTQLFFFRKTVDRFLEEVVSGPESGPSTA